MATFQVSRLALVASVAAAFSSTLANAEIGYFFTRNSTMTDANIKSYYNAPSIQNSVKTIFEVDFNPLTANHMRDLERMRKALTEFSKKTADGIVLFGYSATSKFVAKLASENFNIRGLFLLDPVDGAPPFTQKKFFPVFLNARTHITAPTVIVESEYGTEAKIMGKSCVPRDFGAEFFASHIEPASLRFLKIPGSDHNDFLTPPAPNMALLVCKEGTVPHANVLATATKLFEEFVANVEMN